MATRTFLIIYLSFSLLLVTAQTKPIVLPKPGIALQSVVKSENIDTAVYAEWVDGGERKLAYKEAKKQCPDWILWTDKTETQYGGISYGASKNLGARYLRFGFHHAIPIGSIMAQGGGRPSALKVGATYPGDLNDETEWIPAQRMVDGQPTDKEIGRNDYAIWVFPPGTNTRAIRFSHQPNLLDATYEEPLLGALITKERYSNAAHFSVINAKSNSQNASLIINETSDDWREWSNREERTLPNKDDLPVSADNPEWITLKWKNPVTLTGFVALLAGFGKAEIQSYKGLATDKMQDGKEQAWQTIDQYEGITTVYGRFWPNAFRFDKPITTTAIRLKITDAAKAGGNLTSKDQNGKRTWLGELMALENLGIKPLAAQKKVAATSNSHPPIAIPFTLKEAGYVTLVVEDNNGIRVRNLLSDTWFSAGKNTAWWDGLDDLGRDVEAARHGVYHIPAKFVNPGTYTVRGLVHGSVKTNYEFTVYTSGNPPWSTDDHTGGWMANHSPPQAALFVPANHSLTSEATVYLGSYVTEGPDGLIWVNLDGKKRGGKNWVGGIWTAAPFMARDAGNDVDTTVIAYVLSAWRSGKNQETEEFRITGITKGGDKKILVDSIGQSINNTKDIGKEAGGIAAFNGIGVVSLSVKNKLKIIDLKKGKVIGTIKVNNPTGVAFNVKGELLTLSSNKLICYKDFLSSNNPPFTTVIDTGLEAPCGITLDAKGNIYISDDGNSNQVKVFSAEGQFIRSIGKQGASVAGPYDSLHLNNPGGLTIDNKNQLWIAENDFLPKRVSVWSLDGKLLKAFYGPAKYGGGGTLDGHQKNKYYYSEEKGLMEFELDWKTGTSRLKNILYRKTPERLDLAFRSSAPETPLYCNGKRYFTNCYTTNPTNGHSTAFLFVERGGIIYPAAAMGNASDWEVLKQDRFKTILPIGIDLKENNPTNKAFFIWMDKNRDAQVQPEEVLIEKGNASGVTVMDDLSFCLIKDSVATQFAPTSFTSDGVPFYDLGHRKVLVKGVQPPASSGGNQLLTEPNGWTVATLGIEPFSRYSISGAKEGRPVWSYPNLWPGLHASHEAPIPNFSGELVGPTRLLGGMMKMKGADAVSLWGVNSNHGMVYLFTDDGLFVTTLFEPNRLGKTWKMPYSERGMDLKGLTLSEENFWPTITQTTDGEVYLMDGGRSAIVKIDGLNSVQRLPDSKITITNKELEKSRQYEMNEEASRQKNRGVGILNVPITSSLIKVDASFADWPKTDWVDIDKSGVAANFNSNSKPYNVTGAVIVSSNRLVVGYKTGDAQLLKNSGEQPIASFKTGGALDVMIGTNPSSAVDRKNPWAGDVRLLVTIIHGKPKAMLYKAVVTGTKDADRVSFSSPWRTITFDKVEDISSKIEYAASNDGNYEIAVPLEVLNLQPKEGMIIKGDIGILRGDGKQTVSRVYWSNKATSIVSDVPSEAALTPELWGRWTFIGSAK